jgi:hypothetical protein
MNNKRKMKKEKKINNKKKKDGGYMNIYVFEDFMFDLSKFPF